MFIDLIKTVHLFSSAREEKIFFQVEGDEHYLACGHFSIDIDNLQFTKDDKINFSFELIYDLMQKSAELAREEALSQLYKEWYTITLVIAKCMSPKLEITNNRLKNFATSLSSTAIKKNIILLQTEKTLDKFTN